MTTASEILVTVLMLVGTVFLFVGSLGLATLPDLMRRLHAPTKATTLGIGAMLVASMLYFTFAQGDLSFHEILIALFLFMTAPVSAHMIAKAHILRDPALCDTLPPAQDSGWATVTPPATDPREN
ncbi:Na+/H+ antiporter subunit G [Rhodoplanes roseus]|uniref:Na+/H+ antiporter subunit G n=1 Tax=Rhodoplanes roseus TaxID=29409 RepID=A0A327KIC5_9BRAD|nr:Na+/H+ antiporter subunit G [Rhodoplanes roseus]RAI38500.1 Na+/H+ antiporter subunit G [Rhodoplanes roseus]